MPLETRAEDSNECPAAHLNPQRDLGRDLDFLEGLRIASLEIPEILRDGISDENATLACLPEGDLHRVEGPFPCTLRRDVATLGNVSMWPGPAAKVTSLQAGGAEPTVRHVRSCKVRCPFVRWAFYNQSTISKEPAPADPKRLVIRYLGRVCFPFVNPKKPI